MKLHGSERRLARSHAAREKRPRPDQGRGRETTEQREARTQIPARALKHAERRARHRVHVTRGRRRRVSAGEFGQPRTVTPMMIGAVSALSGNPAVGVSDAGRAGAHNPAHDTTRQRPPTVSPQALAARLAAGGRGSSWHVCRLGLPAGECRRSPCLQARAVPRCTIAHRAPGGAGTAACRRG